MLCPYHHAYVTYVMLMSVLKLMSMLMLTLVLLCMSM